MGLNNIKINNTTNVKTGVVYDISKATGQSYETLADALGTDGKNVPPEVREGGMSVRFVTSDNKYVWYRLRTNTFSTTVSDWQEDADTLAYCKGIEGALSWVFDYEVQAGKRYFIKSINDTRLIASGNNVLGLLKIGEWVEFNILEGGSGVLFIYYGSGEHGIQPEIIISDDENAIQLDSAMQDAAIKSKLSSEDFLKEYQYKGFVTPNITPETPTSKVFYLASPGIYANFNNVEILPGYIGVIYYDNVSWKVSKIVADNVVKVDIIDNSTSWVYNYPVTAGKKYRIYAIKTHSGGNVGLSVGRSVVSGLSIRQNEWCEFTAPESGNPYTYFGSESKRGNRPEFIFISSDSWEAERQEQENKKYAEIQNNFDGLTYEGFAWSRQKVYSIEVGTDIQSKDNFIKDGTINIPQGTKIKVKLLGTTGVLSQIWIVDQTYKTLYKSTEYVDGTVLTITLPRDLTGMSLYLVSTYSVGIGNVQIMMYSNLLPSIGSRLESVEQEINDLPNVVSEIADDEIAKNVIYKIADDSEPNSFFKSKSPQCEYTDQGIGIIMPAGVNVNNYLGVKFQSFNTLLPKLYNKKLHVKFVLSAEGEDVENFNWKSLSNYPSDKIQLLTDTIKYKSNGKYIIVDTDIKFPESGTLGDGQIYLNFKTNNNSSPVTVKVVASYYAILDSIGFDECAYEGQLVYGMRKIAQEEANKLVHPITTTTITCKRFGTSGVDADFCGLTAISDAINSITDASENNRYIIHVKDIFLFTDPLTVPMYGGGEYSIIFKKDYIDIVGDGPNKSAIIMDFPANATFHEDKTYSDYQPIYFASAGGKCSGMSVIGRNCRYAFHLETGAGATGKVIDIENCVVEYQGHPDYTGGYGDCFGTGIADGQKWNFKNVVMRYHGGNAFAMHTPLSAFNIPPVVTFENCTFIGNVSFHNYQVENNTFINFINCKYGKGFGTVNYPYYNNRTIAKHADYTTVIVNGVGTKALYRPYNFFSGTSRVLKGAALRVISATTGTTSVVRFDKESSAYNDIIGDSRHVEQTSTLYYWNEQYGQVYRDGGVGIAGQAFGTWDLDPTGNANNSIGARLRDCSVTNKQLVISVDSVSYTITFNADYTLSTNDDMLAIINAALGNHATADLFSPARLYYPNINDMQLMECADANSIMKGMGVVFVGRTMRRATNSDGYIDGICLDDTANSQYGRVITCGYIYPYWTRDAAYYFADFTTIDNSTSGSTPVSTLAGISETNPGEFDINASPKMLRLISFGGTSTDKFWKML